MDNKQMQKQLSDLTLLSPQPKTVSNHVKSQRNSLPGQHSLIEQIANDSEGEQSQIEQNLQCSLLLLRKQSTNPQEKDEKFQRQQGDIAFYSLDEQNYQIGDFEHLE